MSQRYGNVTGGETLTITGTNFVDAQTTVTIDKIACATTSITST
ncbi:MAG: IPT/TIG domain-containing protein [bacterium]